MKKRKAAPKFQFDPSFVELWTDGIQEAATCACKLCRALTAFSEGMEPIYASVHNLLDSLRLRSGTAELISLPPSQLIDEENLCACGHPRILHARIVGTEQRDGRCMHNHEPDFVFCKCIGFTEKGLKPWMD